MTKTTKTIFANSIQGVVACVLLAGCASQKPDEPKLHGETMLDATSPTLLGQINERQAAAGAKADATLSEQHFQGSTVNSLGQVKLDLISKGTHTNEQIVVYLNVAHETFDARQASVAELLADEGLTKSQVTFVEGLNPNNAHPTAATISTIYKEDGGAFNGQTLDAGGSEMTAAPSSMGK